MNQNDYRSIIKMVMGDRYPYRQSPLPDWHPNIRSTALAGMVFIVRLMRLLLRPLQFIAPNGDHLRQIQFLLLECSSPCYLSMLWRTPEPRTGFKAAAKCSLAISGSSWKLRPIPGLYSFQRKSVNDNAWWSFLRPFHLRRECLPGEMHTHRLTACGQGEHPGPSTSAGKLFETPS